jgi:hypothetical protein
MTRKLPHTTQKYLNVMRGVPRAFKPPTLKNVLNLQKFQPHTSCIAHDIPKRQNKTKKIDNRNIKKLKTERKISTTQKSARFDKN